jgi:hypothetical protein
MMAIFVAVLCAPEKFIPPDKIHAAVLQKC